MPHSDFDRRLLAEFGVFVVNQAEAAAVLGLDRVEPLAAARRLRRLGPRTVVVTAGAHGAAYYSGEESGRVPAPVVAVADASGAGDAFLAALAVALSRRLPLPRAVASGVRVGSRAVRLRGALLPHDAP